MILKQMPLYICYIHLAKQRQCVTKKKIIAVNNAKHLLIKSLSFSWSLSTTASHPSARNSAIERKSLLQLYNNFHISCINRLK